MDEKLNLYLPVAYRKLRDKNRIIIDFYGGTDLFGWMEKTILTKWVLISYGGCKNNAGLVLPGCQPVYNPCLDNGCTRIKDV